MNRSALHKGFTLVEVMLAAGILVIGLILVAGAFPLGIKMTANSTESVIGSVVADEAFAKIRLNCLPVDIGKWGANTGYLSTSSFTIFQNELLLYQAKTTPAYPILDEDLAWPSADTGEQKHYYWSALVKKVPSSFSLSTPMQTLVFVCRITGAGVQYPNPFDLNRNIAGVDDLIYIPKPIYIQVDTSVLPTNVETIKTLSLYSDGSNDYDDIELLEYIPDDAVLVMINAINSSEVLMLEVLEVDTANNVITFKDGILSNKVNSYFWVVPTAKDSTRNPLIDIYQEQISL